MKSLIILSIFSLILLFNLNAQNSIGTNLTVKLYEVKSGSYDEKYVEDVKKNCEINININSQKSTEYYRVKSCYGNTFYYSRDSNYKLYRFLKFR